MKAKCLVYVIGLLLWLIPTSIHAQSSLTPTLPPYCAYKIFGDANCEGSVDLADFEVWRKEFIGMLQTKTADFDNSITINITDFEIWRKSFALDNSSVSAVFSFDSPENPWTQVEITELKGHFEKVYPVIESLYGKRFNPYQKIIIKKAPLGQEFSYAIPPNVITVATPYFPDVLTHELVHVFHYSDARMPFRAYEEGFARAVEIETMMQVFGSSSRDFSKTDAKAYDFYNQPYIGFMGYSPLDSGDFGIERYEIAAYAWSKILYEEPKFFLKLHELYYNEVKKNPSYPIEAVNIFSLIPQVVQTVEGQPFMQWYNRQHIFRTSPTTGPFIVVSGYLKANRFIPIYRTANGIESKIIKDLVLNLEYKDSSQRIFDQVTIHTNPICPTKGLPCVAGYYEPKIPAGYTGWYVLTVTGTYSELLPDGKNSTIPMKTVTYGLANVSDTFRGIGGMIKNMNGTKVRILNLVNQSQSLEIPITSGTFFADIPSRGTYKVSLLNTSDITLTERTVTKSEGPYFIILE